MELKLQRNLVLQELSILQGVVEHRTTIPILSSILAEAVENRLRLVATDLDMTIVTACPAVVHGGGRATLESKVFQNLVRSLPEEEFTLRQDGDAVEITCGRFQSRMAVSDPSEYPTVPEVPEAGEYALPLSLFQLMLDRVGFAITKDDPKFQLNGALVKLIPGEIEIAATDGHRLAMVRAKAPSDEPPFEQQLFPRKLLAEFARFGDDQVRITASDNHLGFLMGERTLVSRIVELRFPQYERVIVRDNAGELTLVSIGYDRGSAEETLNVNYQGESLEIALNAAYLIDVLQVLECDMVELQLRDSNTQCVVVPVDDDARLEEYIYVLMPMRL